MKTRVTNNEPAGFVLYEGPSLLDGAPVVVIATMETNNPKTGPMVQTWIIRADIDPITASRLGADFSICGACKLRGTPAPSKPTGWAKGRACYVNLAFAPSGVFKAYRAGRYPRAVVHAGLYFRPDDTGPDGLPVAGAECIGKGRAVRLGAYGDPAAVPGNVWERVLTHSTGWTGYTHQLHTPGAEPRPVYCMVSADTETEARAAWSRGYRTFRIIPTVSAAIEGSEVICPATPEGGSRTTCINCKLCRGAMSGGRSVAVVAHGAGKKYAVKVAA
jgi:hypothetical protein